MRGHKYKAWLPEDHWYAAEHGSRMIDDFTDRHIFESIGFYSSEEGVEYLQYIGRDDEHKTEMYEGYIIEVDDSGVGGLPSDMKFGYYKIVWEELECGFFLERLDGTGAIRFDECCKYTVLGNVYEHPGLAQQLLNQTALNQ